MLVERPSLPGRVKDGQGYKLNLQGGSTMAGTPYWERHWQRAGTRKIGRRAFLGGMAATGVGVAGLLAGCGGDSTTTGRQGGGPTASPQRGGTLITHDNGDPASLDYIKTWSYRSMMYSSMVYPRLLKFATEEGTDPIAYLITPDLAETMPEQPDDLTYIFKLRPANWEDKAPLNGRPLTAEDVVQNWNRFQAEHPSRLLLSDVAKVEATSQNTVRFTLSRPLGPFVNHMGHQGVFYIQPPELFGTGRLEQDMWSAGPFLFRGYDVGSELRFARNPNYFIQDRPYLDEVIYKLIPDASTTMSALRSKQIDTLAWTGVVSANDTPSLQRDMPGAQFVPYPRQGNTWFGFDLTDPAFQDKRVRQAISMALNRDAETRVYGEGKWVLPYGVLTEFYFDPKQGAFENAKYYQHNLREAKALLESAGVGSLGPYPLYASDVWTPAQRQAAELIQQELREIGIQTEFRQLPFSEFYAQTVIGGKWQGGFAVSANLVGADPNEYFTIFWEPNSPRLIAPGLKPILERDTELLTAIERQRRELDFDRRKEHVREVVNIMADRMYNIPMTTPIEYHVHQANVYLNWIFTYAQEYLLEAYKA